MPSVQKCRDLATALAARALLHAGEGRFDEAWQDLLACHRLGRLVGRGATLIEALVGSAIDQVASRAESAFLERARPTAKQARAYLRDLQGLPPMAPLADKVDLGERFMFLDSVMLLRRHGPRFLEGLSATGPLKEPVPKEPDPKEQQALDAIDWDTILRTGNRWYDRMVAALRVQDRAAREKQLDRIEEDLKKLKQDVAANPVDVAKLFLGVEEPGKMASQKLGNVLIGLLMPAIRKVQNAYDRAEQVQRNQQVAFALAAYRGDHGRYPEKLDALAPQYLAQVPGDLFSGEPLIYRPGEDRYLFYSVGVNGQDDGGRWYDDDPPGDDPGVRMPLPELKWK
jgi:hypothetical protein